MMLKPYLRFLTDSEIHSLMLAGFASVSGMYVFYTSFKYQNMSVINNNNRRGNCMKVVSMILRQKLHVSSCCELNYKTAIKTLDSGNICEILYIPTGSTFAAYISYGARPQDLVTSSIMSAPSALCFSKMLYPETEEVKIKKKDIHMVEM